MKKLISMIALAAISFGSVYAHKVVINGKSVTQQDTTRKKKRMKRDSTRKKDSTRVTPTKK